MSAALLKDCRILKTHLSLILVNLSFMYYIINILNSRQYLTSSCNSHSATGFPTPHNLSVCSHSATKLMNTITN